MKKSKFSEGRPAGSMQSLLTGFLDSEGNARGRPVASPCKPMARSWSPMTWGMRCGD